MTLSDLIVAYRKEHDLSQRQFALQCNLSNGYISMLEKNSNPSTGKPLVPTLVALNKISRGMGLTLDELFSSVDDMPVSLALPSSVSESELDEDELSLVSAWRKAETKDRRIVAAALEDYGFVYTEEPPAANSAG